MCILIRNLFLLLTRWMYKESKKSRKYEYELTKVNDKKFEELKDT